MQPIMFQWGSLTIHWYGALYVAGFIAATLHWTWLGKRQRFPAGFGVEMCFWVMLSSIVGGRLAYIIANLSDFIDAPLSMFRLAQGGLIFYGGLVGAALAVLLLAKLRRIPLWMLADYAISAVPLGHGIGRIGCLLNGCCYGAPSQSWWAVPLNGIKRHPVPLVEATFNLVLYVVLLKVITSKHREGRTLAVYLMAYPAFRFVMEFLRGDARLPGFTLNVAQEVSLLMILVGAFLWFALPPTRHYHPHGNSPGQ